MCQSHDYERHGFTSLFAAMDVASGVTISNRYRRHRHQEFLRFLNDIDANLPGGVDVHLVMDNYGTHKVTKVRTWLARHPRYRVHFTPTSGSWLNLVERLFAELTQRCVRRGSHTAVRSLEKAMLDYLDQRKEDPKACVDGRCRSESSAGSPDFLNVFRTKDTIVILRSLSRLLKKSQAALLVETKARLYVSAYARNRYPAEFDVQLSVAGRSVYLRTIRCGRSG